MRKLLYTALALFTIGGCASNNYYEGRVISERISQDTRGSSFYRLLVDVNSEISGAIHEVTPFNIEGNVNFLDSLCKEFNPGNCVRIKGKDLSDVVPIFDVDTDTVTMEPLITSDRLTKVN